MRTTENDGRGGAVAASRPSILIVDDEAFIRDAFQIYFQTVGFEVHCSADGESALSFLRSSAGRVDVVLLDLAMPGMHGMEVLKRIKEQDKAVEVIIATGYGSMASAIQALRFGAYDYVTKPVVNLDQDLLHIVQGAVDSCRAQRIAEQMQAWAPVEELKKRLAFFDDLDALARSARTAHAAAKDPMEELGGFLKKHLQAAAALAGHLEGGAWSTSGSWGGPRGGIETVERILSGPEAADLEHLFPEGAWVDPALASAALADCVRGIVGGEGVILRVPFRTIESASRHDAPRIDGGQLFSFRRGGPSPADLPSSSILAFVLERLFAPVTVAT